MPSFPWQCAATILTGAVSILLLGLLMRVLCYYQLPIPELARELLPRTLGMQAAPLDFGDSVTLERILMEIDTRLLRASHDDLGLRDFANFAAGARPIETPSRHWSSWLACG